MISAVTQSSAVLSDGNWMDPLPWVVLGLGSALQKELDASSAKLVLGQPLHIPEEFLPGSSAPQPCLPLSFFTNSTQVPCPVHHWFPRPFVPVKFMWARFVFVWEDAHRSPLQPPYDGQFRVLEMGLTGFMVDMGGHRAHVVLDRFKLVHREVDEVVFLAQVSCQDSSRVFTGSAFSFSASFSCSFGWAMQWAVWWPLAHPPIC